MERLVAVSLWSVLILASGCVGSDDGAGPGARNDSTVATGNFSYEHTLRRDDVFFITAQPGSGNECMMQTRARGGFDSGQAVLAYALAWNENGSGQAAAIRGDTLSVTAGGVSTSEPVWAVANEIVGASWGIGSGARSQNTTTIRGLVSGFDVKHEDELSTFDLDCRHPPASFQFYVSNRFIPVASVGNSGHSVAAGTTAEATREATFELEATRGPAILSLWTQMLDGPVPGQQFGTIRMEGPGGTEDVTLDGYAFVAMTRSWNETGTYRVTIDRTAVNGLPLIGILAELELVESIGPILPVVDDLPDSFHP